MTTLIKHEIFGEIRTEVIEKELWFMVKDLCRVLEHSNHRMAVQMLGEDEVRKVYLGVETGVKRDGTASVQNVEALFTNESGLYTLIIRSSLPTAVKFRKWVTSEVLPSIRKFGRYVAKGSKEEIKLLEREERQAKKAMLLEVGRHLTGTDHRVIGRKLLVDEYEVWKVLQGNVKDVTILRECFERSLSNCKDGSAMYSKKGCDMMVEMLRRAEFKG